MRDLDGKTLTNVVKIDGDPSGKVSMPWTRMSNFTFCF